MRKKKININKILKLYILQYRKANTEFIKTKINNNFYFLKINLLINMFKKVLYSFSLVINKYERDIIIRIKLKI
jgi:hypothetical protein